MRWKSRRWGGFIRASSKKILFIGAGASRGARSNPSPPLGPELLGFCRRNTALLKSKWGAAQYVRIFSKAEEIFGLFPRIEDYEELLSLLSGADKTTSLSDRSILHRSLCLLFSDLSSISPQIDVDLGFRMKRDLYVELIEKINLAADEWVVISLNYDLLFEQALEARKVKFFYPHFSTTLGAQPAQEGVAIYKPHGSVNFFSKSGARSSFGEVTRDFSDGVTTFRRNSNDELCVEHPDVFSIGCSPVNVASYAVNDLCFPVMANFTYGKEADFNESNLLRVREEAISQCVRASDCLIVGVNPIFDPKHDPFCAAFFAQSFECIQYVTKGTGSSSGIEDIKKIWPTAKILQDGLEGFVR